LVLMGLICGLGGGAFCTSSTAVAQKLVDLPAFSGWPLRIAASVVLWIVGSFFLIAYARKIRKDPTASFMYGAEDALPETPVEDVPLTPRRALALVAFIIGFVFVVYGATHGWKISDALPAVFMATAIVCGAICGFSPDKMAKEFVKGAKTMASAAVVVAFATGINTILSSGHIVHTIVHALASLFTGTSTYVSALGMYISNLLINLVLCSSSSQATTVIPIFSGVGQVLGLTQQVVVQTFNFGDAFTNLVTPVSSVLMASLGIAGVSLDRWYRFSWKWLGVFMLIGGVFVVIGVATNYGPF
ncbi:MAG: AbgT family transporter, partial [Pyramidobacter sp.]|nr:AbgT family transporter [Pyramidobacter sp.]